MRVIISGVCGFVGSTLARFFIEQDSGIEVAGFDNFIRAGSELNRRALQALGVRVTHADLRVQSDIDALPAAAWLIDAAANASVLAGVDGRTNRRQIVEHNLLGTVQLLEYCKTHRAGFALLSTSRVYAIPPLAALPMRVEDDACSRRKFSWRSPSSPAPTSASRKTGTGSRGSSSARWPCASPPTPPCSWASSASARGSLRHSFTFSFEPRGNLRVHCDRTRASARAVSSFLGACRSGRRFALEPIVTRPRFHGMDFTVGRRRRESPEGSPGSRSGSSKWESRAGISARR